MAEENEPAERKPEQAEHTENECQQLPSLKSVLYEQVKILMEEQAKVKCLGSAETSTRDSREEKLAFSEQIRKTIQTITDMKNRRNN